MVAEEEEGAVAEHGPAQGGAEVVLAEVRLVGGEGGGGGQALGAVEQVGAAVEGVGPALGDDVGDGPAGAAELRGGVGGDDLELLQGFGEGK